jgi:hypothetical protein
MKKNQLKTTVLTLLGSSILVSCGPIAQLFDVDMKVPAKYPLELVKKNIAVFSNIDKNNDSLLTVNLATGFSSSLEKGLSLGEETIPVYNLHSDSSTVWDNDYILSLSQKSNSDVLMVIDKLQIGKLKQVMLAEPTTEGSFKSLYVLLPCTVLLNVYDGITAEKIATVNQTDTVYWQVVSRNEIRQANFMNKVYQSLVKVSNTLGDNLSDNFFGTWTSVQRYLYCFPNSGWFDAFELSKDFKWTQAMDFWMGKINSANKQKSACAAFNLAVACEMTGKTDLALEWIAYSQKCYPLSGIENYKSILKR